MVFTLLDFIIPLLISFLLICFFFFYASIGTKHGAMTVIMIVFIFLTTVQNYPTYVQGVRNVQSERNTERIVLCHRAIRLHVCLCGNIIQSLRIVMVNYCNSIGNTYKWFLSSIRKQLYKIPFTPKG